MQGSIDAGDADAFSAGRTARATRVERSFAFIDLSGFTAYTDQEGDDQAVEMLTAFRSVVRSVSSTRGVRIAKWLGDGAMLVGVEPEPLLAAIVDIEGLVDSSGSTLPVRAGFTCGPVILIDGDDYVGHAVNVAARLCAAAAPREILAPADDIAHLYIDLLARQAGSMQIKGLDEPLEVVSIGR
ncbi:MAG: hypothetical protein AAGC53_13380 [Actinomycetota bacterium]